MILSLIADIPMRKITTSLLGQWGNWDNQWFIKYLCSPLYSS